MLLSGEKGRSNMKKLLPILLTLAMLLCLAPCAEAETPELAIPFRFASKEEGVELLLANKEYYAKFSPNKLDYIMQRTGADMEEYLALAKEQVLDWTDEEKDIITRGIQRLP